MSLPHDVKRGNDAARILAEPLFQEAWKSVEQAIHERWADSPIRDIEGQQQLRLMLKLLGDVRAVLESVLSDGKVAATELERLNPRRVLSPAQWSGRQ
jgi:hypothetical protein